MYALNVFAAIATLATGINAAAFRRNIHVADFRSFGEPGCSAKNLGVWTVIDDDIVENGCNDFNGDVVKSLSLTDINEGYTRESHIEHRALAVTMTKRQQCISTPMQSAKRTDRLFLSRNARVPKMSGRRGLSRPIDHLICSRLTNGMVEVEHGVREG